MLDIQPLTLQQVFDNAWNAFVVNHEGPAMSYDGICVYREGDCKCAIGHSLPEDFLNELDDAGALEGVPASELVRDWPSAAKLFEGIDPKTLDALQGVHDKAADRFLGQPGEFGKAVEPGLRSFANIYDLAVPNA